MASPTQTVTLNPSGGVPEAEITFGDAVLGVYECKMVDPATNQSVAVFDGDNQDDVPDKFGLKQSATAILDRNLKLIWTLTLQLATTKLCHVKITIRQDNAVAQNGEFSLAIQMDDTDPTIALAFVRFA
jgi:hypothetical protein